MEERKKISIIVPVYKVERYLQRCFSSLDQQVKNNIEIIFIDDGSPDKSGEMCDNYARGKEYVRVIHQENAGLSEARNAGLKIASGEYCIFLDSDDSITENACERIIEYINKYDVDVLYLDTFWIKNGEKNIHGKRGFEEERYFSGEEALGMELKTGKYAAMSTIGVYNINFLKKNNLYFKKGIYHEDEQWSPRVMIKAEKIIRIKYPFYNYYIRKNSITQSINVKRYRDLLDTVKELRKIYDSSCAENIKIYGNQYLAKLYLNAMAHLLVYDKKHSVDWLFINNNLLGLKNKAKKWIFKISPKLFLRMMER